MSKKIISVFALLLALSFITFGCGFQEVSPQNQNIDGNEGMDDTAVPDIGGFTGNDGEAFDGGDMMVNVDAYIQHGGMLYVTHGDGNIEETGALTFHLDEGGKINDVIHNYDIVKVEPRLEGDTFEGWMIFKDILTIDETESYMSLSFELMSGDKLYTTDELFELPTPAYDVTYVAKWASLDIDKYFAE